MTNFVKLLVARGLRNSPETHLLTLLAREVWFCLILENMENVQSVRAVAWLCIINKLEKRAGVVQWQYRSFPSFGRGFDSHRPLQKP